MAIKLIPIISKYASLLILKTIFCQLKMNIVKIDDKKEKKEWQQLKFIKKFYYK